MQMRPFEETTASAGGTLSVLLQMVWSECCRRQYYSPLSENISGPLPS